MRQYARIVAQATLLYLGLPGFERRPLFSHGSKRGMTQTGPSLTHREPDTLDESGPYTQRPGESRAVSPTRGSERGVC